MEKIQLTEVKQQKRLHLGFQHIFKLFQGLKQGQHITTDYIYGMKMVMKLLVMILPLKH